MISDVSALETFDITADGTPDVLVGRSDGIVQVYSVDDGGEPTQRFKHVSCRFQFPVHNVYYFLMRISKFLLSLNVLNFLAFEFIIILNYSIVPKM